MATPQEHLSIISNSIGVKGASPLSRAGFLCFASCCIAASCWGDGRRTPPSCHRLSYVVIRCHAWSYVAISHHTLSCICHMLCHQAGFLCYARIYKHDCGHTGGATSQGCGMTLYMAIIRLWMLRPRSGRQSISRTTLDMHIPNSLSLTSADCWAAGNIMTEWFLL